jgi:polyisoprenoid-binding protein YceI
MILLHVGKAGMFKGFGHEHVIAARQFSGYADLDPQTPARSGVSLNVDTRSLRVLPDGEPPNDVPQIQRTMMSPKVLDVERYPRIAVASRSATLTPIAPSVYRVALVCDVELHGVVKPIRVPLRVEVHGDRIVARGTMTIRQTDFGIRPVSAMGGAIKVKDEIVSDLTLIGREAPAAS